MFSNAVKNFGSREFNKPFRVALTLCCLLIISGSLAHAEEVWYNAEGKAILKKDKASGRITRIQPEKSQETIDKGLAELDQLLGDVEKKNQPVKSQITKPALEQSPITPTRLNPLNTVSRKVPSHSYYRSSYPYYGNFHGRYVIPRVIPRFSNNGYYEPARSIYQCQSPYYYPNSGYGLGRYGYRGQSGRQNFYFQYRKKGIIFRAGF